MSNVVRTVAFMGAENTIEDIFEKKDYSAERMEATVIVKEKQTNIKAKNPFVIMFIDNYDILLDICGKEELKIVNYLMKVMNYGNLISISNKDIAEQTKINPANVSRALRKLRDKKVISKTKNGSMFINPHIFSKGNLKDIKAMETYEQDWLQGDFWSDSF